MEKIITKVQLTQKIMPSLMRVAAYARVSSGKEEMLHSLAAQVSYYKDFIKSHPGWIYAGVYADEAFTGTKKDRPEFQKLLEDCRNGNITQVLTKSISRFARNTVDLLETVRELKSINVDVYFQEQNIHTMSGEGEMMLSFLAIFAQEESRSVSENCKWRIRRQFENGELACLRFMFGYNIQKGKINIDPDHANIVRMIFNDYINGSSGNVIAEKLKEMNIQTVKNGKWDAERVMNVIKNEKYTGNALLQKKYVVDFLTKKLVLNKGAHPMYEAKDSHPAIIDQETYDRAQEVRINRLAICGTKSSTVKRYPFSQVITCKLCGKNYKRKLTSQKANWYCSTYLKEGKAFCPGHMLPEQVLYEVSTEVLGLVAFDEELFKAKITGIGVIQPDRLLFIFRDGHTADRTWHPKSRRESWTKEMKATARTFARKEQSYGIKC